MHWTQAYTPVAGSLALSALVAALPVVVLLGLLAFGHAKAHWAALSGLAASLAVAMLVFGMPAPLAGSAALMGAAYGLFPIGWIVLGAIFVYDVTVKSGDFEIVKDTISGLGSDRRIQVLLIAFCFGAFIEGAAGFGTPVAISAAMLIGLGFRPLQAAGLALIANTAPVAFGALGIPIITLATVTGLPVDLLSAMTGRILVLFCVVVPFWVVWTMCGRKQMMEVWPACATAGLTFGGTQYLISNYVGASLAAIAYANSSQREQLRTQALTDELTGLYNRRHCEAVLEAILEDGRRHHEPTSIAYLDVDAFKSINDGFGHGSGDEALRRFADVLRNHTRAGDVVCRTGGEEFTIVLPRTGAFQARRLTERINEAVRAARLGPRSDLTVSAGVATAEESQDDFDGLMQRADEALLRAKRAGRDRVVVADADAASA